MDNGDMKMSTTEWIILVALNYVAAWVIALNSNLALIELIKLGKEEPSVENSAEIREKMHEAITPWFLATMAFGGVGCLMGFLLIAGNELVVRGTSHFIGVFEVLRRYKKAKRGYGIKLEQDDEIDTEALHLAQEQERQSSQS